MPGSHGGMVGESAVGTAHILPSRSDRGRNHPQSDGAGTPAGVRGIHGNVFPVVSLRSPPGYAIGCLRHLVRVQEDVWRWNAR
jgi:hypothetical protein